jgi:two-component system, chemotaxis family, protein-glutamate methylesterase/glutaminase
MLYKAIVLGASAGGFYALRKLIPMLPCDFSLPIIIVQHISPTSDNYMSRFLNNLSEVEVKEVDEKEALLPGHVYIAPPNYHLLIEENRTTSLSTEEKRNYSRPSIDILFETAALAFGNELIGIILTGANHDGAEGLRKIKLAGGYCIVQDPSEAEAEAMPKAAIKKSNPQKILSLNDIAKHLIEIDYKIKKNKKTADNDKDDIVS